LINIKNSEHLNFYNLIRDIFNVHLDCNPLEIEKWQQKTIQLSQDIANLGVSIFNEQKENLEKEFLS